MNQWKLTWVTEGGSATIELGLGSHVLGYSQSADIRVPHPTVSRRHALVICTPEELAVEDLGSTNGTIVYNLVTDIIKNSFQNSYVAFSPEVSDALKRLKDFNLERIYMNPEIKKHTALIKKLFAILFEKYLDDIETENRTSVIFTGFLEDMSEDYIKNHCKEEIVRDFIAGMTDHYFLRQCPEKLRPETEFK